VLADLTAITRSRRGQVPPRYYTRRRVRFVISPGPSGGWSITPAGDGEGIFLAVPTVYRAGTKPIPMLISDTAEYVLGVPKDDTVKGRQGAAARHADYTTLIDSFADATPGDPIAARLSAFVHGPFPAVLADRLTDLGGTSSDLVAFNIDGVSAHQTPQAQAFWVTEVARQKGTGLKAVCSICGGTAPTLASLPESIPGAAIPVVDSAGRPARGQPAQLVSINQAAQGRGGVIQLANTPICADCGGDSVAGLVHLLSEERSHRRNRDSVLAWWSNDTALDDEDPLAELDKPDPTAVAHLLDKLSKPPKDEYFTTSEARRFRAVTLAANKSRVVIRDQIDISLSDLGDNLTAWFADHRIDTGRDDSGGTYIGLWQMAAATGRPSGTGSYLKDTGIHSVDQDLLACALRRAPLPITLLPHLLHRITHDGVIDGARAALLRLCLRRSPVSSPKEATMIGLNEDAPEAAYQCGRLLRILEDIQQRAIPEINTTLADRNRGISRNPLILPSLVKNSRAHLTRLNRSPKTKPAAIALENRLDEVLERINPFPAQFTINEQGLFILGYHHQRAQDRRHARATAKRAHETGNGAPPNAPDRDTPDPASRPTSPDQGHVPIHPSEPSKTGAFQ
jgi:CRISPR-associated protein Csd1